MINNSNNIVLVVDDSPESLGMLNTALNEAGYMTLVALSGKQAISIVEKVEPDIILLDGIMPELDGFETCKILKQLLPSTPIIFMTGLTDVEDLVKGFNAGGSDYVTKPIMPDEVLVRIKTHIQTARLALNAQQALDHAGKFVFSVNDAGELGWATPQVYKLIENLADNTDESWAIISQGIAAWLSHNHSLPLQMQKFANPISIIYERPLEGSHLLRIAENRDTKSAEDLRVALNITKREAEVLYWISHGKSNWDISQILDVRPRTINKHLEQIYKKLDVDNRTSAAAISIRILGV